MLQNVDADFLRYIFFFFPHFVDTVDADDVKFKFFPILQY